VRADDAQALRRSGRIVSGRFQNSRRDQVPLRCGYKPALARKLCAFKVKFTIEGFQLIRSETDDTHGETSQIAVLFYELNWSRELIGTNALKY
jgi:hypothetical protein